MVHSGVLSGFPIRCSLLATAYNALDTGNLAPAKRLIFEFLHPGTRQVGSLLRGISH